MLENIENAFHLTDYNNMSDLYEFQQQYNMAQEFIKHRDEFYQSFTISRFNKSRKFVKAIMLEKITGVVWVDYNANVCSAPASSLELITGEYNNEHYEYYQVSRQVGYVTHSCYLDENRYAIKFNDILYVIRCNDYCSDKVPEFTFVCDSNHVTATITYTEQFEQGPKYYDRITKVNFMFDVHTNELVDVTHNTHEKFVRNMSSWEFCEWMD